MSHEFHGDTSHGSHHVQAHAHHGAAHHASGRPSYFTEEEWADFQKSDRHAGGMVVGLMAAIFSVGLALYTTIALVI